MPKQIIIYDGKFIASEQMRIYLLIKWKNEVSVKYSFARLVLVSFL